ncbi:MAG: indole-3-glycerol phosphate synthase TrpC [Rikenellaceae bacterium]|jgi:indole-3-glycerol phosphate synthase|nr:indole-3-glycerol phosphate synthase TrpC [Rikenellaceae bacterium]
MNILDTILETKRLEVAGLSFAELRRRAEEVERPTVPFAGAVARSMAPSSGTVAGTHNIPAAAPQNTPSIIAEFKRRSPSKGFINENVDPATAIRGYAAAGAAAISVLTDRDYFGGSLNDLVAARAVTAKPLLRKDFVIDPVQICEACIAGADAVLLIAAALAPTQCAELAEFAHSLQLEVLLEIHDETELGHLNPFVDAVGVNNRDLTTFVTDTAVSLRLIELLPAGPARISESGISEPETVRRLHRAGFDGFLMGENFMKRPDPAAALQQFVSEL